VRRLLSRDLPYLFEEPLLALEGRMALEVGIETQLRTSESKRISGTASRRSIAWRT